MLWENKTSAEEVYLEISIYYTQRNENLRFPTIYTRESKLFDHMLICTNKFFTSGRKCEKVRISCTGRKKIDTTSAHEQLQIIFFYRITVAKIVMFYATEWFLLVSHSILRPLALRIKLCNW